MSADHVRDYAPQHHDDFFVEGNRVRCAAFRYLRRGWQPTPLHPRTKQPILNQWQDLLFDEARLASEFPTGTDRNVGLLLGKHSDGLIDCDLDCPEARVLADEFLPTTESKFGRASSRASHWLYQIAPRDAPTVQFRDPADGQMLVELRGTGAQTMVPPSIHPTGEGVEWEKEGEPAAVDHLELKQAGAKLAAGALLARHWPAQGGRHNASLAVAGALLRSDWAEDAVEHFIVEIARAARDEEAQSRRADVRSTARKFAAGEAVTGGPTCAEIFSNKVWSCLREWLGLRKATDDNRAVKFPFRLIESAVEYADAHNDEIDWVFVCSRLDIAAVTRNEIGEEWGRLLTFRDDDGREHRWAMPMELLAGDGTTYRERLLSMGVHIGPGPKARHRLHEYIQTTTPATRVRSVSRLGWHGGVFVLPDAVFGDPGQERVIYQTAYATEHGFRVSGTLSEWQEHVAIPCAGNSRLVFAVSCAFAASLVYLVNGESVGYHLRGPSSLGKTTAILVGGSVVGGGDLKGYMRQWRATANGLEGVAALHCDSLLCLDEISQLSSREAGEVAYLLANGQGKSRARRDGSGKPPAAWRTVFLSTGEISLADKVGEDGHRLATAGQQVRVIDVAADAGRGLGLFENLHGTENGHQFALKLKEATSHYYGTPIREFLARVTENLEPATQSVKSFKHNFVKTNCPTGADGQVQRVLGHFALVAAAGELAIAAGVLPWAEGKANAAATVCFNAWLSNRPAGAGRAEIEAGIAQIRKFFELHGDSRFTLWGVPDNDDLRDRPSNDRPTINRAGFRRLLDGGRGVEFYVFPENFKSELCSGFDAKALTRAMIDKGLLIPGKDGRSSESVTLPRLGKKRCYHFASKIIAEDEE
jgi:putative DNA primase/helicase